MLYGDNSYRRESNFGGRGSKGIAKSEISYPPLLKSP